MDKRVARRIVSTGMKVQKTAAPLGRPRAFDIDKALDRALQVFWRKGYEGASLSELTKAMRINRPSLYAAFGNKEALFRKALERYSNTRAAYVQDALAEPTARRVVERLLYGAAKLQTDPHNPPGCLAVHGALASSTGGESIRQTLAAHRAAGELALRERLRLAVATGDLPANIDPADLARYIVTVIQGMAVQAAGGASCADLQRIIEITLRAWPV